MNDLTPSFEPETGQLIFESRRGAGPAGEARLVPVAGADLAFDRADGRLVRAIVDGAGRPAAVLLTRLLGPQSLGVVRGAEPAETEIAALSPEPGLCAALSSLARLDAARATSPVPASSPWWAAEAAVLAERAGLRARAVAEARRAIRVLERDQLPVPAEAAEMALAAAEIASDPDAARRLRDSIDVAGQPHRPRMPGLDVAAEVRGLEKNCVLLPERHWALDPGLAPAGVFRPGLSPHSDLQVRHVCADRVVVQATVVPGADPAAVGQCRARVVDPVKRRVLASAGFERSGSVVRAQLQLRSTVDELGGAWIEVVDGNDRPVTSDKAHSIQRALRWADAALRAERAPAGLAPQSSSEDWTALAALAWERCRRDWAAADDEKRAEAVLTPRMPLSGPVCLAEVLGE